MDLLLKALQVAGAFLLVLGPLIVIHEFGHFIVAKAFRIGVPVFSIGIGPRLFGIRRGETDYRVSAIPLGGYVRLYGDEADEQRTGSPEEFLSRPRYQRFLVYIAGATLNILLALVVVWGVLLVYGLDELPKSDSYPVVAAVLEDSPAARSGVLTGDRVIRIAGQDARQPEVLMNEVLLSPESVKPIVVEREGRQLKLQLQTGADPKYHLGDPGWLIKAENLAPPLVAGVHDGPASRAGIKAGDVVVGADGREPISEAELRALLAGSPGVEVLLKVERDGEALEIPVTPELRQGRGIIGVDLSPSNLVHREFGVVGAAVESLQINLRLSKTLFVILKKAIRRDISIRAFSGPIEIAQVAEQAVKSGTETFFKLLAFISLQLGILNLLPIPVLDGGHILILGVESVMRRELSQRLKERVMQVGLVFLLVFFVSILYFDWIKLKLSF